MNGKAALTSTTAVIVTSLLVWGNMILLYLYLSQDFWLGQWARWETYYYGGDYSFSAWQTYCSDTSAVLERNWQTNSAHLAQNDWQANLAQNGAFMAGLDWWAIILMAIFVGVGAIMVKAGAKEEAWIIYVFMLAATLVGLMPLYANPIDFLIFW